MRRVTRCLCGARSEQLECARQERAGKRRQGRDAMRMSAAPLFVAVLLLQAGANGAHAQDYYRGKTISMYAGRPPGGGIDTEMRLIAQYLAGHIPGKPTIIPRNMPGAGGVTLGNHLFGVAAPDGLTLGVPGRTGFVLAPA